MKYKIGDYIGVERHLIDETKLWVGKIQKICGRSISAYMYTIHKGEWYAPFSVHVPAIAHLALISPFDEILRYATQEEIDIYEEHLPELILKKI